MCGARGRSYGAAMIRKLLVATLLVLSPALVACSSGDSPSTDSSGASSSSSPAAAESWVEITDAGVRFKIPADWQTVTPDDVSGAAADSPAIQDIADRMSVTVDQFRQMVQQAAVWAFAPEAQGGFSDNVNVIDLGDTDLVTEAEVTSQLAGIGAQVLGYENVATSVGDGARYSYTIDTGERTIAGSALAVKVDAHMLLITYSATSADTASSGVDLAVESIESLS